MMIDGVADAWGEGPLVEGPVDDMRCQLMLDRSARFVRLMVRRERRGAGVGVGFRERLGMMLDCLVVQATCFLGMEEDILARLRLSSERSVASSFARRAVSAGLSCRLTMW